MSDQSQVEAEAIEPAIEVTTEEAVEPAVEPTEGQLSHVYDEATLGRSI